MHGPRMDTGGGRGLPGMRAPGAINGADFARRFDAVMRCYIASRGERRELVEALYNEDVPDGLSVRIVKDDDGCIAARFSNGRKLTFRDWEELGAAALLLREAALAGRLSGAGGGSGA